MPVPSDKDEPPSATSGPRPRKLRFLVWVRDSFRRAPPVLVLPNGQLDKSPVFDFVGGIDYHIALFDMLTVQVTEDRGTWSRSSLVTRFSIPLRDVAREAGVTSAKPNEISVLTLKRTIEFPKGDTQPFLTAEDFLKPTSELPIGSAGSAGSLDLVFTLFNSEDPSSASVLAVPPRTLVAQPAAPEAIAASTFPFTHLPDFVVRRLRKPSKKSLETDDDTRAKRHDPTWHLIRNRFLPAVVPWLSSDPRHRDAFINSAKDVDSLLASWFGITNIIAPRRWMSAWDVLKGIEDADVVNNSSSRPAGSRAPPPDPEAIKDAARWIKFARAAYGRSASKGLKVVERDRKVPWTSPTAVLRMLDFRSLFKQRRPNKPKRPRFFFPDDEEAQKTHKRDKAHAEAAKDVRGAEAYLSWADPGTRILFWSSRPESVSHPVFFFGLAPPDDASSGSNSNTLVISIRGTWSVQALVSDLVAHYTPLAPFIGKHGTPAGRRKHLEGMPTELKAPDGRLLSLATLSEDALAALGILDRGAAHRGFLAAAVALLSEHAALLESLVMGYRPSKIVVTGHSYGAATAVLLGASLYRGGWLTKWADEFGLPELKCEVFAFAPVPVVSPQVGKLLEQDKGARRRLSVKNFVMDRDEVPRISFGAMLDMRERVVFAGNVLNELAASASSGNTQKLSRDQTLDHVRQRLVQRRRDMESRGITGHPKLQLLGDILLFRREHGQYECESAHPHELLGVRARPVSSWIGFHELERCEAAVKEMVEKSRMTSRAGSADYVASSQVI